MEKGDMAAAEKDFRTLIEDENFHTPGSYCNLGTSLLGQGRIQEAIPYLEKAVILEPLEGRNELTVAYDMLSSAYMMAGNPSAAKSTLEKGLKKLPGDTQLQVKLDTLK